jgi:hypothetical protein
LGVFRWTNPNGGQNGGQTHSQAKRGGDGSTQVIVSILVELVERLLPRREHHPGARVNIRVELRIPARQQVVGVCSSQTTRSSSLELGHDVGVGLPNSA